MARWGFNTVQLFISWQDLEQVPPTYNILTHRLVHHYNGPYVTGLDQAIARFRRAGLAVVLSMMQSRWSGAFQNITTSDGAHYPCGLGMPAWLYERNGQAAGGAAAMVQAEVGFYQNRTVVKGLNGVGSEPIRTSFTKAWQYLASRYRRNRTVVGAVPMFEAYDILTRSYPGASGITPATLRLAKFFEQIGGAIHRVNPRLLIFFTEQKSRTTHKWALLRRPRVRNGVVTTEFYAGRWPVDGKNRLRLHYRRARGWHYPFYVDEFDAFGKTRTMAHPHWRTDTRKMLAYCRFHHISWTLLTYGPQYFQVLGRPRTAKRAVLRVIRRGF